MEGMMMKKQPTTSSAALALNKDSQTIYKPKPKIRIIHIIAPEIIKTDVANFRELVQRLTGKPTESNTKKKPRISRKEEEPIRRALCSKKMEQLRTGFRERVIKGEEEIWGGGNHSTGGYLGGFADLDGFMKELNEFPLFPNLDASHMDALGETTQLA